MVVVVIAASFVFGRRVSIAGRRDALEVEVRETR